MTQDVEWLSDAELRTWLAYLRGARTVLAALDHQLRDEWGIPHSWYGLLAALEQQPDRTLRQGDLAVSTDFSLSRLSNAVGRMSERGWVERTTSRRDRRATDLTLTDLGAAALARMAPGHVATVRELVFDRLDPSQVEALGEISRAILGDDAP